MEKDDAMSRNDVPLIENNLDFLPFVPDAVILADGEYPVHEYPLRLLRETPYIVCCDGAANTFISHGYIPNMIIGDGDSLSVENRTCYSMLPIRRRTILLKRFVSCSERISGMSLF